MTRLSIAAVLVGAVTLLALPGNAQSETMVTVVSDGAGKGTLGLVLDATNLPAATVDEGGMTIE